jgi:class 3 adenylate cyclase
MPNELRVTCFTDLADSTKNTEQLGHEEFMPLLRDFHAVVRGLSALTGGSYKKDTGDGDILTFADPERAIQFAAKLQMYYADRPSLDRVPFRIRVGMFSGVVQDEENNVFGSGANRAARIQALADVGEILIDESLRTGLASIWPEDKLNKYVQNSGTHELKGVTDPVTLFSFDWQSFVRDYPSSGLAKNIAEHLERGTIAISNVSDSDLSNPGIVVWPVVPRSLVTAIHRGQTEIIKLLALLGWKVHLLIADCKAEGEYSKTYSEAFRDKLAKHIERRGINLERSFTQSEFYETSFADYDRVQALFRAITSDISWHELELINDKDYDAEKQAESRKSPTLNFLRPALLMAVVIYLAEKVNSKVLVVAGADERRQWERSYSIASSSAKLGVVLIPILRQDKINQTLQGESGPIWYSERSLADDMQADTPNNLAWWIFDLHAYVPAFPADTVKIGEKSIKPQDWTKPNEVPTDVDVNGLVRIVWPILNPALT